MNAPTLGSNEGVLLRDFTAPNPAPTPFSLGSPGSYFSFNAPSPTGWQHLGPQQPQSDLFNARNPAQRFLFGKELDFDEPAHGSHRRNQSRITNCAKTSVTNERSEAKATTESHSPATLSASSKTSQYTIPGASTSFHHPVGWQHREQLTPNLFVPITTKPQSLGSRSALLQSSQQPMMMSKKALSRSSLDLFTILEALPDASKTPETTSTFKVSAGMSAHSSRVVSQPERAARNSSSPTKSTAERTPYSPPNPQETREDQIKHQVASR